MHSLHPYVVNSTSTVVILHPVVVSATMPMLIYEDVALVEPGVAGAAFGTADFRDYVVMEASKNGLDWVALQDGYDARLHAEWLSSYDGTAPGSRSLLRRHEINLLDHFSVNDTLLFRYRLYSDGSIAGWGAALDYVAIQEEPTGLETNSSHQLQVFPNPVTTEVTARYTIATPSRVSLEVLDPAGKRIHARDISQHVAGTFQETFSMIQYPPGVYFVRLKTGEVVHTSKIVVSR